MTPLQKAQLRSSEIRSRMADLASGETTDEVRSEIDALKSEYRDVETRSQALMVSEDKPTFPENTAEGREAGRLETRSTLSGFILGINSGNQKIRFAKISANLELCRDSLGGVGPVTTDDHRYAGTLDSFLNLGLPVPSERFFHRPIRYLERGVGVSSLSYQGIFEVFVVVEVKADEYTLHILSPYGVVVSCGHSVSPAKGRTTAIRSGTNMCRPPKTQ